MTIYLDASVVVSLFADDAHSVAAQGVVSTRDPLLISDLTAAEFASALAIHLRTGRAAEAEVRAALARFDQWSELNALRVEVFSSDIRRADALIRQLDNPLRMADATHLMIAQRLGAALATFDVVLAREAGRLGVPPGA